MAVSVITKAFPQVFGAATTIQSLGSLWYQASTDFEEFQIQVDDLRRVKDVWFAECSKYGDLQDEAVEDAVKRAASLLERTVSLLTLEERKLKRREAAEDSFGSLCPGRCWPMLCFLTFPAEIKARIKLVVDTFEKIPDLLKREDDVRVAMQKRMLNRVRTLQFKFRNDPRYVSFEESESAVHEALKKRKAVVLLHGGPGCGKSTLARHVALHYSELVTTGQEALEDALFEQVIYLECGPNAKTLTKQIELLGKLDLDTASFQGRQESTPENRKIPSLLEKMLRSRNVLLIFDDVWSEEFLQDMIDRCGIQVKCLVTSRQRDLCRQLNRADCSLIAIPIQDIPVGVAEKLLATYVGYENKEIPDNCKNEIDKIIQATANNPLALASVAAAISQDRAYDVGEWKMISKRFFQLLKTENTPWMQSMKYPTSFWSAMQLSLESLTNNALRILPLVHLCEDGVSIPEEVMEYFDRIIPVEDDATSFQEGRKELEDKALLTITTRSIPGPNNPTQHVWFVHSLKKQFMEEHPLRRKELVDILMGMSNAKGAEDKLEVEVGTTSMMSEEASIRLVLCALYFEKKLGEGAASKMGIPYDKLRRADIVAIEPILSLFIQLDNEDAENEANTTKKVVMQIILRYVCDEMLDHDGITNLFSSPTCTVPMLGTLSNIARANSSIFAETPPDGWLVKIVDLLSENESPHLQQTALWTLSRLAEAELALSSKILECNGILEHLSNLVSEDIEDDLQFAACATLCSLAINGTSDSAHRIITFPNLLEKVIILLSEDRSFGLNNEILVFLFISMHAQVRGVEYRSARDYKKELCSKVLATPGALEVLSNLLAGNSSHQNDCTEKNDFRFGAILILDYLVTTFMKPFPDKLANIMKIIKFSGLLTNMVQLMSDNSHLQNEVAHFFGSVARMGFDETLYKNQGEVQEVNMELFTVDGLLETLLALLAAGTDLRIQEEAAYALTLISPARGNEVPLFSSAAYIGRGIANSVLANDKKSLADFDNAVKLQSDNGDPEDPELFRWRRTVRAKLEDYQGALDDADSALKVTHSWISLNERGIVKRMMKDLPGALADFNESLELGGDQYETLKHRGYVRFLMGDEEGARFDAELAIKVKDPEVVDCPLYHKEHITLAASPVEYLEFKLR